MYTPPNRQDSGPSNSMRSPSGRRKAIDVWDQLDLVRHDSLLAMYDAGG